MKALVTIQYVSDKKTAYKIDYELIRKWKALEKIVLSAGKSAFLHDFF